MLLNSFYSGISFSDDVNFPQGFCSSGAFSSQEAESLQHSGYVMQQLKARQQRPENEEQEHFVQVMEGKASPLYKSEYLFLKYLQLIADNKPSPKGLSRTA